MILEQDFKSKQLYRDLFYSNCAFYPPPPTTYQGHHPSFVVRVLCPIFCFYTVKIRKSRFFPLSQSNHKSHITYHKSQIKLNKSNWMCEGRKEGREGQSKNASEQAIRKKRKKGERKKKVMIRFSRFPFF